MYQESNITFSAWLTERSNFLLWVFQFLCVFFCFCLGLFVFCLFGQGVLLCLFCFVFK